MMNNEVCLVGDEMNKTLEEQIKEKEQELKRLKQIKKEQDAKTKRYVTFDVQGLFDFSAKKTYYCSEEEEEQISETLRDSFTVESSETEEIRYSEADVTTEVIERKENE